MSGFRWSMTEGDYGKMLGFLSENKKPSANLMGKVSVGKFDAEIVMEDGTSFILNLYHLGIDANYGKTESGMPYSFEYDLAYSFQSVKYKDFPEFKAMIENDLENYFKHRYDAEKLREEVFCPLAEWN